MQGNNSGETVYVMDEGSNNVKEYILKILRFWPWLLLGLLLGILSAYFYVRYTPKVYVASGKIKILDDESSEIEIPLEGALLGGNNVNLENEIQILKSYRLLEQVVEDLDLNITYKVDGEFMDTELWKPSFRVMPKDSVIRKQLYYLEVLNNDTFEISTRKGDSQQFKRGNARYNTKFSFDFFINDDKSFFSEKRVYQIIISTVQQATSLLKGRLTSAPATPDGQILNVAINGQNIEKNRAIVNSVMQHFNEDGILDRRLVYKRTVDFIDERFSSLAKELDSIEIDKKDYKQANGLSFLEADAEYTLSEKGKVSEKEFEVEKQIALAAMLKDALNDQDLYRFLPADIGIESGVVNKLIAQYNELLSSREEILLSAKENNPRLININLEINNLRQNIHKSLIVYNEQLKQSLDEIEEERSANNSSFSSIPDKELMMRAIERQQNLKEGLYVMLLQKREEAAIKYAVTSPTVKVVDYAMSNPVPIAPKVPLIFAVFSVIGVCIPIIFIYLSIILNTKVLSRETVEQTVSSVPFISELPHISSSEKVVSEKDNRSMLAESFRILSTNVDYLLLDKKGDKGNTIFVTSTIKGEGKTFVALNLSLALASLNKRVLLLGADLRNPQLHKYFDVSKSYSKGLSGYLFDPSIGFDASIEEGFSDFPTHNICFSGVIPPNAPQLLASRAFSDFISQAREKYDYIIVDTAPTILVTDTLLISKYADETVYVLRAGFTEKKLLEHSKKLFRENKLRNMAYVLNDVGSSKNNKYGYGYKYGYTYNYGYGYGYGADVEPKKKKWYNIFKG